MTSRANSGISRRFARRDLASLLVAIALHVALLMLVARGQHRVGSSPTGASAPPPQLEVEVELATEAERTVVTSQPGNRAASKVLSTEPVVRALPPSSATVVPPSPSASVDDAPTASPVASAPRPIDLGLEGGIARSALLDPTFGREPSVTQPSIGLLAEGLAAMDAKKGISRSSAAVSAGYQSASSYGPSTGIALFDVRADAGGVVVSVTLVSEGPDQQRWEKVAAELRARLARSRLRTPPGAAGLLTRIRIERGYLAEEVAAMNRLERGAALGQGALPQGMAADESTQSSLGRGLTPTAGIYSSDKRSEPTRVVIVSEKVL